MTSLYQVMIVDDELGAIEQLSDYVSRSGLGFHVVAKAQGAEEAIFSMNMAKPDLIITDIRMPVMDGLKMLQNIRESGWRGQAAIVTGYDDFSYAQQAIRLGVSEYLLKPVFPENIAALLQRARECFDREQAERVKLRHEIQAQYLADIPAEDDDVLPSYLLQAKNYIKEHYAEPLTLTQVAKVVSVNPAYLSSRFAKYCDQNFLEYVTRYRVKKAQELLEHTNHQIQEIATQIGYSDIGYFNRVFRRETGQTPGSYRAGFRR